MSGLDLNAIWDQMRSEMKKHGIDVEVSGLGKADSKTSGRPKSKVKVVVVSPNLQDSVEELGQTTRDQVVMVRVDEETSQALDDWVNTGAVKSRSEAAALFIKEGLHVRQRELDQLREALREVETARARLREKAREVFGREPDAAT
ncbi:MAG: hypothetical protein AAFV53_34450 [Myxococcota bacterium]